MGPIDLLVSALLDFYNHILCIKLISKCDFLTIRESFQELPWCHIAFKLYFEQTYFALILSAYPYVQLRQYTLFILLSFQ